MKKGGSGLTMAYTVCGMVTVHIYDYASIMINRSLGSRPAVYRNIHGDGTWMFIFCFTARISIGILGNGSIFCQLILDEWSYNDR